MPQIKRNGISFGIMRINQDPTFEGLILEVVTLSNIIVYGKSSKWKMHTFGMIHGNKFLN